MHGAKLVRKRQERACLGCFNRHKISGGRSAVGESFFQREKFIGTI